MFAMLSSAGSRGDRLLTLVEGSTLLGPNRLDGLVDGTHPNDLGISMDGGWSCAACRQGP